MGIRLLTGPPSGAPVMNGAGPAGFEPSSAGVKVLCLTAWR